MKRILLSLAVLSAVATGIAAQQALVVKDARSIAMGGAFTALSSGYQSLYGNPAGFAVGRGMLTLANVSAWGFFKPTSANLDGLGTDPMGTLLSQVTENNGLGGGAAVGLGFTGGGLGLGLTAVSEDYIRGLTLGGSTFYSVTQLNIVAGMAITLGPKDFNLKIGGDLRPFAVLDSAVPASTLLGAITGTSGTDATTTLMNSAADYGLGLAADLGAIFTMGSLSAGLSIRDISPSFGLTATTIGDVLSSGGSPSATSTTKGSYIPNIAAGLGWSPRFIPGLIDPSLYFEVQDPLRAIQEESSFWNLLHVGGELRLLSFIYLRGGLNQGWLTAGAGFNLLILEIDGAVFTEELGRHPGDAPRSGVAMNVRLHL